MLAAAVGIAGGPRRSSATGPATPWSPAIPVRGAALDPATAYGLAFRTVVVREPLGQSAGLGYPVPPGVGRSSSTRWRPAPRVYRCCRCCTGSGSRPVISYRNDPEAPRPDGLTHLGADEWHDLMQPSATPPHTAPAGDADRLQHGRDGVRLPAPLTAGRADHRSWWTRPCRWHPLATAAGGGTARAAVGPPSRSSAGAPASTRRRRPARARRPARVPIAVVHGRPTRSMPLRTTHAPGGAPGQVRWSSSQAPVTSTWRSDRPATTPPCAVSRATASGHLSHPDLRARHHTGSPVDVEHPVKAVEVARVAEIWPPPGRSGRCRRQSRWRVWRIRRRLRTSCSACRVRATRPSGTAPGRRGAWCSARRRCPQSSRCVVRRCGR